MFSISIEDVISRVPMGLGVGMTFNIFSSKGKHKINVPDKWEKLSTGQYQEVIMALTAYENKNSDATYKHEFLMNLFSILTGMESVKLYKITDPEIEAKMWEASRFIMEPSPLHTISMPRVIQIKDKIIAVPKNIERLSIGQNLHLRIRMDTASTYDELISFACAVFLQPNFDNSDFDYFRAVELEEPIKAIPITDTYPIGFFLLRPPQRFGTTLMQIVRRIYHRLLRDYMTREAR